MRVIIAGGREFDNYELLKTKCDAIFLNNKPLEIVSGRCQDSKKGVLTFTTDEGINVYGADGLGERYAKENNIPVTPFPPRHDLYGNYACPVRNKLMGKYGTHLIAAWNGYSRGTAGMINIARNFNLPTRIINY